MTIVGSLLLLGVLALAVVLSAPSLDHPCEKCDRDEKMICRATCPEYQQWKADGEWAS